jgi:hypothetical protein
MTRVFIDRRLLSVDTSDGGRAALPGASDALAYLTDAGFDVRVVDRPPAWERSRGAAWLLTPDRADCRSARRRGCRTILVGPHTITTRPTERCDDEARDLSAAALALLATEAMGQR